MERFRLDGTRRPDSMVYRTRPFVMKREMYVFELNGKVYDLSTKFGWDNKFSTRHALLK